MLCTLQTPRPSMYSGEAVVSAAGEQKEQPQTTNPTRASLYQKEAWGLKEGLSRLQIRVAETSRKRNT